MTQPTPHQTRLLEERLPDTLKHITQHLGPAQAVWSRDAAGETLPFTVLHFSPQPVAGASTFLTHGLAETVLLLPGGIPIRQELMLALYDGQVEPARAAEILLYLGSELLKGETALQYGGLAGPFAAPFGEACDKTAFYLTPPNYFPDALAICPATSPPTLFLWAVPVTEAEGQFAYDAGGAAMEALLADANPDVLNVRRPSLK